MLVDKKTRVLVQGITGKQGSFHTKLMLEYGTNIVAGVTPGKGGQVVNGIPVYDNVKDALRENEIDASIIFVPATYAKDACMESILSGIKIVVVITEMIPIRDAYEFIQEGKRRGITIIGPNTPGIISPGESKLGIMPGNVFLKGNVGVISRSGTLMYEIASMLSHNGIGQSTCIGVGGDRIVGTKMVDVLRMFKEDEETRAVVIIGEIGGGQEEEVAEYIATEGFDKTVVAYIAGRTAPPEKRMGHAGAIIAGGRGDYKSKVEALKKANVDIAVIPSDVAKILRQKLD